MLVTCECGCGKSYPKSQCVRLKFKAHVEDLYIPHALDVWGLFTSPFKLNHMLKTAKIYGVHLPGERVTAFLNNSPEYQDKLFYVPRKSPYGIYYLSCQHLLNQNEKSTA